MSLEATLKRQVPEIRMNKRVLRYGICPLRLTFIFNFRCCTPVSGECPCAWPRQGRREGYHDHDHRDPSQAADTGRICHLACRRWWVSDLMTFFFLLLKKQNSLFRPTVRLWMQGRCGSPRRIEARAFGMDTDQQRHRQMMQRAD